MLSFESGRGAVFWEVCYGWHCWKGLGMRVEDWCRKGDYGISTSVERMVDWCTEGHVYGG